MSEVSKGRRATRAELTENVLQAPAITVAATEEETEIDLLELFFRLLESWKLICATAFAGAIIMAIVSLFLITPHYEATAKLYIMNSSDSAINLSDLQIGSYLTSDYREVFKTWEVHERVIENLGLEYTYDEMESIISVTNPSDTRMLYITANTTDPQEATNIANEYAVVARQYISDKMATDEPSIMSVALKPTKPVSPNKTLNVIIGFVMGAFLMAAIITIRFIMDDKIKTADDITKYVDIPTLALVPAENNGEHHEEEKAKRPSRKTDKPSKPKRKKG